MNSPFDSAKQILQAAPGSMPDEEAVNAFFVGLRVANGTCKMTSARRLVDVDERVGRCLAVLETPPAVRILDAGASTGTTTHDLLQQLERRGYLTETTLLDVAVNATLYRRAGFELLADMDGRLLFVRGLGWRSFRPDPTSPRLRSRLGRVLFGTIERVLLKSPGVGDGGVDRVQLVVPGIAAHPSVTIVEHDLEWPLPDSLGKFDLVRAANLLNLAYFPPVKIERFLENLLAVLRIGGVLVIGRTGDDGANHFSILRRDERGDLAVLDRHGQGSEVEQIALSVASRSQVDSDGAVA